jgi:hypothetical protein
MLSRHYQEAKDCFDFIAGVPLLAGLACMCKIFFFVFLHYLLTIVWMDMRGGGYCYVCVYEDDIFVT